MSAFLKLGYFINTCPNLARSFTQKQLSLSANTQIYKYRLFQNQYKNMVDDISNLSSSESLSPFSTQKIFKIDQKVKSKQQIKIKPQNLFSVSYRSLTIKAPYFHSNKKSAETGQASNLDTYFQYLRQKSNKSANNSQVRYKKIYQLSQHKYLQIFFLACFGFFVVCLGRIVCLTIFPYSALSDIINDGTKLILYIASPQKEISDYPIHRRINLVQEHLMSDVSNEFNSYIVYNRKTQFQNFVEDELYQDIQGKIDDQFSKYSMKTLYGKPGIGKSASLKHYVMKKREEHKKQREKLKNNPNNEEKPKIPAVFYIAIDNKNNSQVRNVLTMQQTNILRLLLNLCHTQAFKDYLKSNCYPSDDRIGTLIIDNMHHFKETFNKQDSLYAQQVALMHQIYKLNKAGLQVVMVSNDKDFENNELVSILGLGRGKFNRREIKLTKNDLIKYLDRYDNLNQEQKNKFFQHHDNKRDVISFIYAYLHHHRNVQQIQDKSKRQITNIDKQYRNQLNHFKYTIKHYKQQINNPLKVHQVKIDTNNFHKDFLILCYQKPQEIKNREFLNQKGFIYGNQFKSLMIQRAFEEYLNQNQKEFIEKCPKLMKKIQNQMAVKSKNKKIIFKKIKYEYKCVNTSII